MGKISKNADALADSMEMRADNIDAMVDAVGTAAGATPQAAATMDPDPS